MSKLVEKGVVKKDILEPEKFDLFIHSFFILSIHWLNNFLTYDFDKDYKEVFGSFKPSTLGVVPKSTNPQTGKLKVEKGELVENLGILSWTVSC